MRIIMTSTRWLASWNFTSVVWRTLFSPKRGSMICCPASVRTHIFSLILSEIVLVCVSAYFCCWSWQNKFSFHFVSRIALTSAVLHVILILCSICLSTEKGHYLSQVAQSWLCLQDCGVMLNIHGTEQRFNPELKLLRSPHKNSHVVMFLWFSSQISQLFVWLFLIF